MVLACWSLCINVSKMLTHTLKGGSRKERKQGLWKFVVGGQFPLLVLLVSMADQTVARQLEQFVVLSPTGDEKVTMEGKTSPRLHT